MNFHESSISQIRDALKRGETTPEQVFRFFQERSLALNGKLNAFVTIEQETPILPSSGPLAGIPIGVKDVFCQK